MPELPEVEVVCQALKPICENSSFVSIEVNCPNLRYPLPKDLERQLSGYSIQKVSRRAKYLLVDFSHHLTLIWHLGMSGRVIIENSNIPSLKFHPHDHVIFTTSHNHKITYRDPRRFGFLLLFPTHQLTRLKPFDTLGPDAFGDINLTLQEFHARVTRHKTPLKNALLNQKIIAGIGNIYASEALWQAKLSPLRLANTLDLIETTLLLKAIQDVLKRAIEAGGSTLRDHAQPNGDIGYFQHFFQVYDRENQPCNHCQAELLSKIMQSGRATYYCQLCQQ
jgi:formamidopyrimidine-DNA glycosylase